MKITDVVFTNHAVERMKSRGINGDWAWQTVKHADTTNPGKEKHTTEFVKEFGNHHVTVIAKKNDVSEWVVLSVWMDPPLQGTQDYYKKVLYKNQIEKQRNFDKRMQKSSFWGKLLLTFRKQIGL